MLNSNSQELKRQIGVETVSIYSEVRIYLDMHQGRMLYSLYLEAFDDMA